MTAPRRMAAIVSAGISGYSEIKKRNADEAARLLQGFFRTVSEETKRYEGELVQERDAACTSVFESETNAAAYALELQRILQGLPVTPVRIGVHKGEVVQLDNDLFGQGITIAAYLGSIASPGSILLSGEMYEAVKDKKQFAIKPLGAWKPGDLQDPIQPFALANEGLNVPTREDLKEKTSRKEKISKAAWVAIVIMILLIVLVGAYIINVFMQSMG